MQRADKNIRLEIGLRFNRAWELDRTTSEEYGSSNMSIEKHEGQHSTEINRVICRRVCHTYNRFPHKWTYCGSPMANIFSRPEHNPCRFSGVTKDRQREILSIVQKRLCEKNWLHLVPLVKLVQNIIADALEISR